jgi:hypothetical protein
MDKGNACPTCDLVRTLLIPRLDQLEAEMKMLREVTWPVCQGILEDGNPLNMSDEKRRYFRLFFKDEALDLLNKKAKFTGIKDPVLMNLELDSISSHRQTS